MRYPVMRYIFLFLLSGSFIGTSKAQNGLCPQNLDFEMGDFTNWVCRAGIVDVIGGINTITWTSVGPPVANQHTMIPAPTAGTDMYGGFPQSCPNGSGFSVKLGNETATTNGGVGKEASGITYTYTIPASATTFSIFFWYAVVLQNPGHAPEEQPRFRAKITDLTTNTTIPCVTFDFTASSSLPGFLPSLIDPNVLYKDWTPVTLNLSGLAGRTIELEFIASECTRQGHFGYAYIDVNSNCAGAITGNYICPGDPGITLTAPYGFQAYTWYSDPTFTTVLSNTQTLPLFPPPSVGTVFPVVVEPYPGFGCRDTLYATVDVGVPPVSDAGPDRSICQGLPVQIGAPPVAGYSYAWTPAGEVSNPAISNPFAIPATSNPTEFIVTTTDIVNGCVSRDTTIVSTFFVDTVLTVTGNPDFCVGEAAPSLAVSASSTAVQWHELSTGPVPGATNPVFQPALSGTFWAEITQGGCLDSTRSVLVSIHPLPISSFTVNNDTGCVTNNSFVFTNSSSTPDNAPMDHIWRFSDGTWQQVQDATKSFSLTGSYQVKLVTTTSFGCKDSTEQTVYVLPNGIPDFTWDSICTGKPVRFTNRSNENGSLQTGYVWNFNNGDPPVTMKDPFPVTFNTAPGPIDVILKMATLGCENDTQTVVRTVQVNRQAPGYRYRDITVPQNSSAFIHVRDTIGTIYNWRPPIHLSTYTAPYAEFFADGNDVLYFIDITDKHTCVTTDTLQMLVLKKPGYYLPTAFTPNNDGLNDLARPYLIGMKGLKSFSVFNRWGQLIYYTQTYGEGWDGKYRGVEQPTGVYVWVLEFYDNNDKLVTEKGTITVIR